MRERPVLYAAIISTLLVEVVLMIMVYQKIGPERLPFQAGRLIIQIILILFIVFQNSSKALFILTAYHFLSGLIGLMGCADCNWLQYSITIFHICIALIIYFHDNIENKIFGRSDN